MCRLLDIDTTDRAVMINLLTVTHIFERRPFRDAANIVSLLTRGEFNPEYCGKEVANPRSFFFAELLSSQSEKFVRVVLKYVSARTSASKHDEIWVTTAHMVEDSTLLQMLRGTRFVVYRTTRGR